MVILQAVTPPIAILLQDARPAEPAGSHAATLALVALIVLVAGGLALVVAVTAMAARRAAATFRRDQSGRDAASSGPRAGTPGGEQVTDAWKESARRMRTPGARDDEERSP